MYNKYIKHFGVKMKLSRNKIIIAVTSAVLLLAVAALILFLTLRDNEEDIPEVYRYGDFEYIILENERLEIVSYLGDAQKVDLPDAISGRSVYSVAASVFEGLSMESVSIGAFTEVIGERAFYECTKLSEVELPPFLRIIGDSAFAGCAIYNIELPETLETVGDGAFYECTNLEKIALPNSIVSVGKRVFAKCAALSEVTLGAGVLAISDDAFYECAALSGIALGDSLKSIGARAPFTDVPRSPSFISVTP